MAWHSGRDIVMADVVMADIAIAVKNADELDPIRKGQIEKDVGTNRKTAQIVCQLRP